MLMPLAAFYSRHYIGMDVNVSFEALEKKE